MPDLWSYPRTELTEAAMSAVGFDAKRVLPLSSGLYVHVELTNGDIVTVGEARIAHMIHAIQRGAR